MIKRKAKPSLPKTVTWNVLPGATLNVVPLMVPQVVTVSGPTKKRPGRRRRPRAGLTPAKPTKSITTVTGGAWQPKQDRLAALPYYRQASSSTIANAEKLFRVLAPGGLCCLSHAMGPTNAVNADPQELWPWFGDPNSAPVKGGTVAMYAGPVVRCERSMADRIMHVTHHSFIVGTGRYIISPDHIVLLAPT